MLLLPDEQTGETWVPSRKQCSSEIGERWIEKNFQFCGLYWAQFLKAFRAHSVVRHITGGSLDRR